MSDALDEDWSVPESAVMDAIGRTIDRGERGVLATIVGVEGSGYRRPGAKMVVSEGGAGVGSITAGCLEDDVRSLAETVREEGVPRVERFDLTADDVWGLGLGCNGVIDLLVEPLDDSYRPVVEAYEAGRDLAVLTVLDGDAGEIDRGDRVFAPDSDVDGATADGWPAWLLDGLETPVERLLAEGHSETVTVDRGGSTARVFVDAVTAPPDLVVFGSGHDVRPVVELARKVDFRVTVVSFRGGRAAADRFPEADRVRAMSPPEVRDELALDGETYAVVMTHNFVDDRLVVAELLASEVPYVGLMGPRERFEEMVAEFAVEGREFTESELERIYTPIGLNLGGGTPYEIAMSIVAEAQAVATGREPTHLRDREAPIHERIDLDG